MSKVDTAINQAYGVLESLSNLTKDPTQLESIRFAMEQLKPFYRNPATTYTEERDAYWKEMMDVHFDGHFKDFSPEQVEKMLAWFRDWDTDLLYGSMDDILWNALHENGLDSLVYGD